MERAIQQEQVVKETLDILMSDVNSLEDLLFVNDAITDYETEFHCDLKSYRKKLIELKRVYLETYRIGASLLRLIC